jgi:hypothetical protein
MELRQRRIRRRVGLHRGDVGRALIFWLAPILLVLALSMLAAGRS